MGLDMNVYKVQKPSLDPSKVYDQSELSEYVILPPYEAASDLYAQVVPYAQKLRVINSYYDIDKICEDFHMPNASIYMISSDGIKIGGKLNGVETTQEIGHEEINTLYIMKQEEICLVFSEENVAYWRNEHELQDLIYRGLGNQIQNEGFYLIDEKTAKTINRYCGEHDPTQSIDWYTPTETSALFYYEWY